mgnify:CR=1 FL=1
MYKRQEIDYYDLLISDEQLVKIIKKNKNFLDQNSKFDRIKYEKFLIENNLNASDFEMIQIPKITGVTVRQARKTIESLGFIFGEIEYVDDIARDEVISISHDGNELNEGDYLKRTSAIDFKLGNGKQ